MDRPDQPDKKPINSATDQTLFDNFQNVARVLKLFQGFGIYFSSSLFPGFQYLFGF